MDADQKVAVGDVVIVVDDRLNRGSWLRGSVTATFPERNGKIRVVDVKTASGIFRGTVVKLCILDVLK